MYPARFFHLLCYFSSSLSWGKTDLKVSSWEHILYLEIPVAVSISVLYFDYFFFFFGNKSSSKVDIYFIKWKRVGNSFVT